MFLMKFKYYVILSFTFLATYASLTESDLNEYRISNIHKLLKSRKSNCTDVANYFLLRSVKYNPVLNAIISYNPNLFKEAAELDDFYGKSDGQLKGRLHCIPIAVKDVVDVVGMPTTAGIKALRNSYPLKDAEVIARLRAEGALFISKTNLGELGTAEDSSELGGTCRNPFDLSRSCGSSSLGSGVSVSSALSLLAIGTDTDGSIQTPGSFNGIFTLRTPQYRPKTTGIFPFFEKQDTVGPMAKYLDDLVLTYSIMSNEPQFSYDEYERPVENTQLKVGLYKVFFSNVSYTTPENQTINYVINSDVKQLVDRSIGRLKDLNINVFQYDVTPLQFDTLNRLFQTMNTLFNVNIPECLSKCKKYSLDKYFGDPDRFGHDSPCNSYESLLDSKLLSKRWKETLTGWNVSYPIETCATSCESYDRSKQELVRLFDNFFEKDQIDAFLLPARLHLPYVLNSTMNGIQSLVSLASLSGFSSLNVPVGYTTNSPTQSPDGLPVSIVLISKAENLMNAFKIAKAYEQTYGEVKLPHTTPRLFNTASYSPINFRLLIICLIFLISIL